MSQVKQCPEDWESGGEPEDKWAIGVKGEKGEKFVMTRMFQKTPCGLIRLFSHLHSKAFSWMFIPDLEF